MNSGDFPLTRRVRSIPSSPTVVFRELAQDRLDAGYQVFDLTIGEPDFDTPAHIVESAYHALRAGFTHYVNSRGISELLVVISEKLQKDNGLCYAPGDEILVTLGGKQAIFCVIMAVIQEGDEVLILDPAWVSYDPMVRLAGGTPVHIPLSIVDNFHVSEAALASHLTERTRMIIVNSPNNPTGRVLTRAELGAIASVAARANLLVISDEIYEKLVYDGREHVSIASFPGMRERTFVVNGFSKTYAMTGWRLGYVAGPAHLMNAVLKVHQHSVTCATSFAQKAAVAALTGPQDDIERMVTEFKARRDLIVQGLNSIPGVKCPPVEGAFYAFPDMSTYGPGDEVGKALLQQGGVALIPGSAFGASCGNHLRLSFAASRETLERALEATAAVLARIGR